MAKKAPNKVIVAKLDARDVFIGTEELEKAKVTPMHVVLPDGCDLPPNKYRWDRGRKSFVPIAKGKEINEQSPLALNAIAAGFIALHLQGATLPSRTLDWLDYYIGTVDFYGFGGDEMLEMVMRFKVGRDS